jgi:hypothetical protein
MRKMIAGLTMALAALPGMAHAATPPCLTAAEFTSLASYGLPSVITGATQRCAATLPADAWLKQNGTQLSARYAQAKPRVWPGAKAAFMKFSDTGDKQAGDLIKTLPDATLQAMLDGLVEGMIAQQLPTKDCGMVDRLVRLLSPLPPENTAELIALAAGLGAKSGQARTGKFSLCPA